MADPVEDEFAAGLELDSGAETTVETVDETPEPVQDTFMSQFRELVDGVPEETTKESLADYLVSVQEKAAKAEEVARKAAEYEAQFASMAPKWSAYEKWEQEQAAAQAQASQSQAKQAAVEAEVQRRFQIEQIAEEMRPYLAADYAKLNSATGMYEPLKMVPQVIEACNLKNRQLQRQAQFAESFTSDPYNTTDELVRHSTAFKTLQQEFQAYQKQMEERFAPIQQNTQQAEMDAFVAQRLDVMAIKKEDGSLDWSPAGQLFNELIQSGLPRDRAFEIAKKQAALIPAPVATPVVEAPAKPQVPLVKKIIKRMAQGGSKPAERGPQDAFEVEQPWRQTTEQLRQRVMSGAEF